MMVSNFGMLKNKETNPNSPPKKIPKGFHIYRNDNRKLYDPLGSYSKQNDDCYKHKNTPGSITIEVVVL